MRRSVLTLTTACLLAASAVEASAEPIQISIHVTQADLESDAAVANLYQRVEDAAAAICAEAMAGSFDNVTSQYSSRHSCQRTLVDNALKDTRFEPLARYYAQVRGHSRATELAAR